MTVKFSKDHEWIKIDGETAILGITSHASEALGELVYVELPEIGDKFEKGDSAIVVESSKSASDVYLPASCDILEINKDLDSTPNLVNDSPLDKGWLVKIKISDISDLDDLMNEKDYNLFLKELS